jgi:hypothetical protein
MADKVEAYQGWAIYADFDGNAPDSEDLVLVDTYEIAEQLCNEMNKNPGAYTIAYVQGFEHCKQFNKRPALAWNDIFAATLEEALSEVKE